MSVYERSWERDDALRREALPDPQRIESDIERWARSGTYTPPPLPRRTRRSSGASSAGPTLLLGLVLIAAALTVVVVCLVVSGAVTMT